MFFHILSEFLFLKRTAKKLKYACNQERGSPRQFNIVAVKPPPQK
jgi:hypothetical protein